MYDQNCLYKLNSINKKSISNSMTYLYSHDICGIVYDTFKHVSLDQIFSFKRGYIQILEYTTKHCNQQL